MRTFPIPAALFSLLLAAPVCAQQQFRLAVFGGPAAGLQGQGFPSRLTATVNGMAVTVQPPPGIAAPGCSLLHEGVFQAFGFQTWRNNANEFVVFEGPGGQPLDGGVTYGTDDPNLDLAAVVDLGAAAFFDPTAKLNGALVPLPRANQLVQAFGGNFDVCARVRVGGLPVVLCAPIVLQPGFPPAAMANDIRVQLEIAGLLGNRVWIEDPLVAGGLVEVLQLERTVAGDPIEGAELWFDPNARLLLPTIAGAGVSLLFGASEYGQETPPFPGGRPWSLVFGQPQLGGVFNVIHETWVPNTIAVEALSLAEAPLPLPVFGGWLLVDPAGMVLELMMTDVNGRMQRLWQIPPNPMLFGFELFSQGIAFQPPGLGDAFSTGVRCVIGQ